MMKKLFFTTIFCVIGIISFAQDYTISAVDVPNMMEAGQTVSVRFNYTAAAETTYQVQVFKTLDGATVDFSNDVGGTFNSGMIAAATMPTEVEVMVTVPGTTAPSNTFTAPEGYIWFIKINSPAGDVVLDPAELLEITEPSNITNGVLSTDFPATAEQESTISVSFDYVASMDGTYQVQLFKTLNGNRPDFDSDAVSDNFTGDLMAAATSTKLEIMATIPADLPTSDTFTAPEGYIWFIKITVDGVDYEPSTLPVLEVTESTLSVADIKFDENQIFFNNANNLLTIQDDFNNKSLDIFDVKGQKIKTINNISSFKIVDLSSIPNGLYIARSDNKYLKFVR